MNLTSPRTRFTLIATFLVLVVAASLILANRASDAAAGAAPPQVPIIQDWPLRVNYEINSLEAPTLDAPLATSVQIFEGYGWHSWRDYSADLNGACQLRTEEVLIISGDGCATDLFGDDYDLKPGQPYGANPFLRMNGGLLDDVIAELGVVGDRSPLAQQVAERLGMPLLPNLVTLSTQATITCGEAGMECDYEAVESTDQVLHLPTGVLLYNEAVFDGQVTHRYEATSVEFDVENLPEILIP